MAIADVFKKMKMIVFLKSPRTSLSVHKRIQNVRVIVTWKEYKSSFRRLLQKPMNLHC